MTLRFEILGFELGRIQLDIERDQPPVAETVVDKSVGIVSDWWLDRLFKRGRK
jgi:hypothetical protein